MLTFGILIQKCFPHLQAALPVLAKYKRPLLVHAEVPQPFEVVDLNLEERRKYLTYLKTRPSSWYYLFGHT